MAFVMRFRYSGEVDPSAANIQNLEAAYGESATFWKDDDGSLGGVVRCSDQQEFISLHNEQLRNIVVPIVEGTSANRAVINQFPTSEFMELYNEFAPFFNLTIVSS